MASGLLIGVAVLALLWTTIRIRRGRAPQTRPLKAFDDLPDQLGYSAERGAPLLFTLGTGPVGSDRTLASIAALETLHGLADAAVAYSAPPLVAVGDPTLLPLAEDILRRAWNRRGFPERHNPNLVRFIGVQPLAYAAGVADILGHERVHAHILMGSIDEEAALITHAAEGQGIPQSIAVDRLPALGALYPAEAALAAGEELYAGPARVTGLPRYLGSLQVQDLLRLLVVLLIFLKTLGIW
ncbi:MAG: hypothetical protein RML46_01965 [Anaerolineae bacterium]|nr:hypothetical protein [Anaerolineae bacterium]MDW8067661.1 hypothetical protein [Anaerolineae bacterium]